MAGKQLGKRGELMASERRPALAGGGPPAKHAAKKHAAKHAAKKHAAKHSAKHAAKHAAKKHAAKHVPPLRLS